jgi:hypothetical protein
MGRIVTAFLLLMLACKDLLPTGRNDGDLIEPDDGKGALVVRLQRDARKFILEKSVPELTQVENLIVSHALAMLNGDWDSLFSLAILRDSELANHSKLFRLLRTKDGWLAWLNASRDYQMKSLNKWTPSAIVIQKRELRGFFSGCHSYGLRVKNAKGETKDLNREINAIELFDGHGWRIVAP